MGAESLPTREVAESRSSDPGRRGNRWKATNWSFIHDGRAYWVKDVRWTHPLFRATVGRLGLWREARIHRHMSGIPFVPRCVGRLDRDALVFEFVAGVRTIGEFSKARALPPDFFDEVEARIRELHRRGILHMDLRHRSNLLVDAGGSPLFVDFETAVYLGRGPLSLTFLRPLLGWADYSAVVKFRARYQPETLTPAQARGLRRFRRLRRLWPFGRVWPVKWRRRGPRPVRPYGGRRLIR